MVTTSKTATGSKTVASGPDPAQTFEFRYKVVSLNDLIASNDATLQPDPRFPKEIQPRLRDREASRQQVVKIASKLQPDALLTDLKTLDRGPMIVGADNVVESGNGRTIALLIARKDFPDQWQAYQDALAGRISEFGITLEQLQGIDAPVLVRERLTEFGRVQFAALANQSATLTMSPLEQANQDASSISDNALSGLTVGEAQGIDQALKATGNRQIVTQFLNGIPDNERAALVTPTGELNQVGLNRVKAAVFAKVFPGAAGQRLTTSFFESLDPGIKTIENSVFDSLATIAKAEGLARSGNRAADLALGEDLAKAVDVMARLKQEGISVEDFLSQKGFFERELTEEQEKVLAFLDEFSRSRKRQREFFKAYATAVINAPPPNQAALFPTAQESKVEILTRVIDDQRRESGGGSLGLFGLIEERQKVEGFAGPRPEPRPEPQPLPPAAETTTVRQAGDGLAKPDEDEGSSDDTSIDREPIPTADISPVTQREPITRAPRGTNFKGKTRTRVMDDTENDFRLEAIKRESMWELSLIADGKRRLIERNPLASITDKRMRKIRRARLAKKGVKKFKAVAVVTSLKITG